MDVVLWFATSEMIALNITYEAIEYRIDNESLLFVKLQAYRNENSNHYHTGNIITDVKSPHSNNTIR